MITYEYGLELNTVDGVVKVSKRDFVDTLYCWLSEHLTEKEVKGMALEVGFKLKGFFRVIARKRRYEKFYGELFILTMYLVVLTCEGEIEDEGKKKDVLELFHKVVYEKHIKITGVSYRKWRELMKHMYNAYRKAMESESLLTPLLLMASEFERNLFGKESLDHYTKFELGMRLGGMVKHLSKVLQGYEVE